MPKGGEQCWWTISCLLLGANLALGQPPGRPDTTVSTHSPVTATVHKILEKQLITLKKTQSYELVFNPLKPSK